MAKIEVKSLNIGMSVAASPAVAAGVALTVDAMPTLSEGGSTVPMKLSTGAMRPAFVDLPDAVQAAGLTFIEGVRAHLSGRTETENSKLVSDFKLTLS